MSGAALKQDRVNSPRNNLPPSFKRETTVYAVAFDLDIEQLKLHQGDHYNNAYLEIRRLLDSVALFPGRTHVVGCYALGKCQRLIALLRQAGWDRPIWLHGALASMCEVYRACGVEPRAGGDDDREPQEGQGNPIPAVPGVDVAGAADGARRSSARPRADTKYSPGSKRRAATPRRRPTDAWIRSPRAMS